MKLTPKTPITFGETTLPLAEWASLCDRSVPMVLRRARHGWPLHEALLQPADGQRTGAQEWRWDIPYEEHLAAQHFIRDHAGGATLDEVAEFFGVPRGVVRTIEVAALRRLRRRLEVLQDLEEVA
ncbi:MAG: sigma factor-like helix-turn-helix DNA-binding protein [Myxococcota bacterium]